MNKTASARKIVPDENRMGTENVSTLLIKMALPMMVSMLILALYNIVDSIFVSRISEAALAAVSLVFPFQMIITAVSVGTGVGVSALVARRLGEKKPEEANMAAATGVFLGVASTAVLTFVFVAFPRPMLAVFTDDPGILDSAVTYLRICNGFCFFPLVETISNKALQGTGDMIHPMLVQSVGAVFNMFADPVLIFGYLGFPAMGVAGAAIATITGEGISMCIALYCLFFRNPILKLKPHHFIPRGRVIADVYRVGLPSIIIQALGSVTNFVMNKILIDFTATAVSVLGVYFKLQSFVFMPVFGLNSGALPLMSYNYGAKNRQRFMDTLKYGCIYAVSIMIGGLLLFQFFPKALLSMFNASENMLAIGEPALRIISLHFPIAAFSILLSTSFQAIGKGSLSLIISVCRQIVVIVPVAWLLAHYVGLGAVWYAYVIAEAVSITVCLVIFSRVYKKYIKNMGEGQPA